MAVVDLIFLAIIAIFSIRCWIRGLVSELMSMAALIFGLLAAVFLFRKAAYLVRDLLMPNVKAFPEIISFVIIFLIVFGVIKMLEAMLKGIIEGIKLNGIDRFLGLIFGFAEGLLIVCLLLFLINIQPFVYPGPILQKSFFAQLFLPLIMGEGREPLDSIVTLYHLQGRPGAGV